MLKIHTVFSDVWHSRKEFTNVSNVKRKRKKIQKTWDCAVNAAPQKHG